MDFYHGSAVGGLTELRPIASPDSNRPEPLVYLTTLKQLALHYITECRMLDIRADGTIVFQEMFSGALAHYYKGISGYIYTCRGDYAINPDSKVRFCATSALPVPVGECEFVEDVYERVMEYGRRGEFIYERYEDLPPWRYDFIQRIVYRQIARKALFYNPSHPEYAFYQAHYGQYLCDAEELQARGRFEKELARLERLKWKG